MSLIMIFVSLTRLRVRSVRFMPLFGVYTVLSLRQVRKAPGFLSGKLLPDRKRTFWTMTAWVDAESMQKYRVSGAHKAAMPRLLHWCDEASVAHWMQEETTLPSWEAADERMRNGGRISKVRRPSADHSGMTYAKPRTAGSVSI